MNPLMLEKVEGRQGVYPYRPSGIARVQRVSPG